MVIVIIYGDSLNHDCRVTINWIEFLLKNYIILVTSDQSELKRPYAGGILWGFYFSYVVKQLDIIAQGKHVVKHFRNICFSFVLFSFFKLTLLQ